VHISHHEKVLSFVFSSVFMLVCLLYNQVPFRGAGPPGAHNPETNPNLKSSAWGTISES